MNTYKLAGMMVLASMMIFSILPMAEAKLWELVVDVNVQNGSIISGETVSITGRVVDHAYKPVNGAEVTLRTGTDTLKVFTDVEGMFATEFKDMDKTGGTYIINIVAVLDEMRGMTTTSFLIKGEASHASLLQQQLATEQARKYLGSNESDFEKDPIGQTLFKYYHGLLNNLISEKKEDAKPDKEQIHIEEQKQLAQKFKKQAIDEHQLGIGLYRGFENVDYITGLKPEIKEQIAYQLNFTKNTFEVAQTLRAKILETGGTYEEAQKAYLEAMAIPKEVLEQVIQNKMESKEILK